MRTWLIALSTVVLFCPALAVAQQTMPAPLDAPAVAPLPSSNEGASSDQTTTTSEAQSLPGPIEPAALPAQTSAPSVATSAPTSAPPAGPWSLGAGLQLAPIQQQDAFTTYLMAAMGGSAMLSFYYPDTRNTLALFVEYQLSKSWALVWQARAGFSVLFNRNLQAGNSFFPENRLDLSLGAAFGCRAILNPDGPVEFSILALAYTDVVASGPATGSTASSQAIDGGVALGMAVEKQLLDNLDLRFQTTLLDLNGRVGVMSTTSPTGILPAMPTSTTPMQIHAGIDVKIEPTLELRLHF